MDGQTFDALARLLAGDTDRRSVVKRLVAGALAGSFALRRGVARADDGGDEADDDPICGSGTKPCGDTCIPNARCCSGGVPGCPTNETCSDGTCGVVTGPGGPGTGCDVDADCTPDCTCHVGTCACDTGTKRCGNACIPTSECCGGCPSGENCSDGSCSGGTTPHCAAGTKRCGDACIQGSECCHDGQRGCTTDQTCSSTGVCTDVAPPSSGGGTVGGGTARPPFCQSCKRGCERKCRSNGKRDPICRRDCTTKRCKACRYS